MQLVLTEYLSRDHDRLDGLLERATGRPEAIDMEVFGEFRRGLLRHIAIEEKIVLPAIARLQGGQPSPLAERIRRDHGAIVALLVPPPWPPVIATLRSILSVHNALEEAEGGMYRRIDELTGQEAAVMLEQMKAAPAVPVLPHNERPDILEVTRRAVERAGYEFLSA